MLEMMIPVVAASIPALFALFAALHASRSAKQTAGAEIQAQKIRDLENRISEKKLHTYEPMLKILSQMRNKEAAKELGSNETRDQLVRFGTWVSVYGSDEAVGAYRNFMQSMFGDAPVIVKLRLSADFMLAARKDIGDDVTKLKPSDVLAIYVTDIYKGSLPGIDLPFDKLCQQENWDPPWIPLKGEGAASRRLGK